MEALHIDYCSSPHKFDLHPLDRSASSNRKPLCKLKAANFLLCPLELEAISNLTANKEELISSVMVGADNLCNMRFMNKRPKIVKHQRREVVEETAASVLPPVASPAESPVASPAAEFTEESVEVSTSLERWEALYVPPPNAPGLSEWQQELREIEWEQHKDAWESQPYD